MTDISDITPKVTIEGADEAAAALTHIGEVGAEAFAKIIDAAAAGDFEGLATLIGGELAGSFTKAAEEALDFVKNASEAAEQLENLSAITGSSVSDLQGLGEAFASVGIGTQGFERSMTRLSMTIAQSWASIQESARTSGTEEVNAQLGLQEAALNTEKAYQTLSNTMEEVAEQGVRDSQRIVDAQLNLQKAANTQAKGQGVDTSTADKLLKQQEEANAVTRARQSLYEANQKAADDEASGVLKIQEAQLAVQKAQQAQVDAEEKAYEASLKNIPEIAKDIEAVASGTEKWTDNTKLAAVSAENLERAVIAATAAGGKTPDAVGVLKELATLFDSTAGHAVDMGTKVELVSRLMGAGFRSGQASASQLIAILEKGPAALQAFQDEAKNSPFALKKEDSDAIKDFNAAWAELAATIAQAQEKFAAFAAPTLTLIFKDIREAILAVGAALSQLAGWIDNIFGEGTSAKIAGWAAAFAVIAPAIMAIVVVLGALAAGVAAIAGPVAVLVGAFAAAYGAMTLFISAWPTLTAAAQGFVSWFENGFGSVIKWIEDAISKMATFLGLMGQSQSATQSNTTTNTPTQGKAGGGLIRGPGGPTSDTAGIFALSDGEYVVKSAAVSHYGPSLFEALNNLAIGGFATGGRVGSGIAMPNPNSGTGGSSILNLTIDGEHFNGLRAPNDVAQKLKTHAVARQSSAAGRNPSWMR